MTFNLQFVLYVLGACVLSYIAFKRFTRQHVKVITVIDGDTFIGVTKSGERIKVRIAGIDCPELAQPHGENARMVLANLIGQKWVVLHHRGRDRYKRALAYVYVGQTDAGKHLLSAGLAWPLTQGTGPVRRLNYRLNSLVARLNRRGLWASFRRTAPWETNRRRRRRK